MRRAQTLWLLFHNRVKAWSRINQGGGCILGCLLIFSDLNATACIWDAVTLEEERTRRPNLAQAIEGTFQVTNDLAGLRVKIQKLEAAPQDNADWFNELAGAYLRAGDAKRAVALLEPVLERFSTNYGVHANLGTAYHLLGNYQAAEKEISRDLELNPNAHFGLERYHLALLQYLVRDPAYQKEHVYIDEWTGSFTGNLAHWLSDATDKETGRYSSQRDYCKQTWNPNPPAYLSKWGLASDPKFEEGIIYMATLNPQQPACFTMLGIAALARRDFNLARTAFQKALALGSPQAELLKERIQECDKMISKIRLRWPPRFPIRFVLVWLGGVVFVCGIIWLAKVVFKVERGKI